MKDIKIKSIELLNFKGIRDLAVNFNGYNTDISADNGIGKTTIFDAFTWVLFGKDHNDNEKFNIKTLDANNKVIPRIPHEVKIILIVDGEEVKLTRRYNERWTKKRGAAEETFEGHTKEQLYNDVPYSESEWKAKINDLCPEQVFKFITNPLYFSTQTTKVQREMLFRMAGGVSDAEVAAGNIAFTELLTNLTGKTLEEFKREVACKKKRVKNEIDEIPGQLKELRRQNIEPENWQELEDKRALLLKHQQELLEQIADSQKAHEAELAERRKITDQINNIESRIRERRFEIEEIAKKKYRSKLSTRRAFEDAIDEMKVHLSSYQNRQAIEEEEIKRCEDKRTTLLEEYKTLCGDADKLTEQYNTGAPTFTDNDFRCPTCGYQYDIDRIEEIQERALEEYRKDISAKLALNAQKIEDNKARGRANNNDKQQHLTTIQNLIAKIDEIKSRIKEAEASPDYNTEIKEPDVTEAINADQTLKDLLKEKGELEKANLAEAPNTDNTAINNFKAEISAISSQCEQLAIRLAKRAQIASKEARINELETALRNGQNEITRLEGLEFTIQEFSKARIESVEKKINSLFTLVRFIMFKRQVNGQEIETCEATVNGVPYSDLNDAGKINAGLDIINAICRFEKVYAPIFLDNAESINTPLRTASQLIRLIVSKDRKINIKASE